jgi:hypothetical protein
VIAIYISLFLALVAILAYGFVTFDRLLRTEYEAHRTEWEMDGKPAGFFWRAPECVWFLSHFARLRVSFAWLFTTPEWIAASPHLRVQLRRQRLAVLIWNVGVIVLWVSLYFVVPKLHENRG